MMGGERARAGIVKLDDSVGRGEGGYDILQPASAQAASDWLQSLGNRPLASAVHTLRV